MVRAHDNRISPRRVLKLEDIGARLRHQIGDIIEEDCFCDSDFMMEAMDRVGAAIHKAYYCISPH